MLEGVFISDDVLLDLTADLTPKECTELLNCLCAYRIGDKIRISSRVVKTIFKRIVLDNERPAEPPRSDISLIRAEAGKKGAAKRWGKEITNDGKSDGKKWQNMANDGKNGKTESKEEERSKEEENTLNNINTLYKPPSLEEIKNYAESKGYIGFNAESFWYFYDSKNWMVGKTKMKNWKSAVSGWYSRDQARQEKPKPAYVPKDDRQTDYTGITRDLFLQDLKGG